MGRHYLFVMWEGGGNVAPTLGVARRLIARGHRVTVLGDPTIRAEAERDGCAFRPWQRAPHRRSRTIEEDPIRDWETSNPFAMLRNYRDKVMTEPAARYAADTIDALSATNADVVVPEYTILGAFIAAEARGVPAVGLVPNIWPLPAPGAPPFGPGFQPARSFLGRMRDAFFRWLVGSIFDRATPRLNATRRELGLPPLRRLFAQMDVARGFLVLTSPTFDFTSPHVPEQVRYVGPILDDPQWVQPWTSPWPAENQDPLVLVSFSSTFQNQGTTLRNVVQALSRLRVRALVTLGEMLAPEEVPASGSVVVVRSVPHREVLPRASLLVTHCGHGTTMKALAEGVPMVCMPMGRDQDDTAARVVHAGCGVRLGRTASPAAIERAVQAVLADSRYAVAARRMRDILAEEQRAADVAAELERLVPAAPRPRHPASEEVPRAAESRA